MKKLFLFIAAALVSTGMWAADPTVSNYDWEKDVVSFNDVVKTYSTEGITLTSYSTTSLSNNSGVTKDSKRMQYLTYGTNATALNTYNLRIKSTKDIIDSVAIFWVVNGNNETQPAWIAWADGVEPSTEVSAYGLFDAVKSSRSYDNAVWFTIDVSGKSITEVAIARSWRAGQTYDSKATDDLGTGQTLNILGYKVWTSPKCTEPTNALQLNLSPASDIYAGDPVTIGYTGGNGSAVTITVDGETLEGTSWTAVQGAHTIAISQESVEVETVMTCGGSDEVAVNVAAATAVSSVTVAGPESAYAGFDLTYTATAENATAYEWYLDGSKQEGCDSAKFIYSAVKGDHIIVCKARNKYNKDVEEKPTWVSSADKELSVDELCGELVKIEVSGTTAGTVSGILTGTKDVSLQNSTSEYDEKTGYKIGADNQYLGIKDLNKGLQAGDTAIIFVTTVSANLILYADKGTTKIGEMLGDVAQGENKIVLNSEAAGKKAIYLYRVPEATDPNAGKNMNPYVYSLAIKRPCSTDPGPSTAIDNTEASVKAVKVLKKGMLLIEKNGKVYNAQGQAVH